MVVLIFSLLQSLSWRSTLLAFCCFFLAVIAEFASFCAWVVFFVIWLQLLLLLVQLVRLLGVGRSTAYPWLRRLLNILRFCVLMVMVVMLSAWDSSSMANFFFFHVSIFGVGPCLLVILLWILLLRLELIGLSLWAIGSSASAIAILILRGGTWINSASSTWNVASSFSSSSAAFWISSRPSSISPHEHDLIMIIFW